MLFLIGLLIGTAMVIPGVSGGVIAVIFGVYDKLIESLNNLFKDFKSSFKFLFILGLGIIIGAVWFSNVMLLLYERHELLTKFAFIGLILGSVPHLFRKVHEKTNKRANYIIVVLVSITLFLITMLSKDAESSTYISLNSNNIIFLFVAGIIYSSGKVIPGISGSFLLIMLGIYEYILKIVSNPFLLEKDDVIKLIPFCLGFIFGMIVFLKLMSVLLKKYFRIIYSIIIGFVIGSITVLLPNINSSISLLKGVTLMILSFALSYKMAKNE